MGLIAAQGSVAAQAQIGIGGEQVGHQPRSGHNSHADRPQFQPTNDSRDATLDLALMKPPSR